MLSAFLLLSAALYGLSLLLYLVFVFGRDEGAVRMARAALLAALAIHLGMIGYQCTGGYNPLRDLRGALSLTSWLLGAGFLALTHRRRMSVLGTFIAPLSLCLLLASRVTPQAAPAGGDVTGASRALGNLHIFLSATGVAIFALAAAVGVIYLLQERALKLKQLGRLFRVAPPLTSLDAAGRVLILVGFPLYTLAVVTGVVWSIQLGGGGHHLAHAISLAVWVIFAALIGMRVAVGMRGRKAALLTIVGFIATVVVLLLYMLRRMMGS